MLAWYLKHEKQLAWVLTDIRCFSLSSSSSFLAVSKAIAAQFEVSLDDAECKNQCDVGLDLADAVRYANPRPWLSQTVKVACVAVEPIFFQKRIVFVGTSGTVAGAAESCPNRSKFTSRY